jgi:hypothetical protein
VLVNAVSRAKHVLSEVEGAPITKISKHETLYWVHRRNLLEIIFYNTDFKSLLE